MFTDVGLSLLEESESVESFARKVNMESFADLLQRARIRHRTKISTDRLLLLLLMMLMLLLLMMMMMLLLMLLMMIISTLKMFV